MRVTMSERQFSEQIRQLEGLGPEVTTEEITHLIHRYARRLFDHVRNYGVQMLAEGYQLNGTIATMQAQLNRSYSEEDCQTRINGLAMLAPLSVSLDQQDLPAFVTNPMMLTSMSDNWTAFGESLQRIALSDVRDALENVAVRLMQTPVSAPTNEFEQELQQLEYEQFLLQSGKHEQLRKEQHSRAIEEARQKEEAAYAAQQERDLEAFVNGAGQ